MHAARRVVACRSPQTACSLALAWNSLTGSFGSCSHNNSCNRQQLMACHYIRWIIAVINQYSMPREHQPNESRMWNWHNSQLPAFPLLSNKVLSSAHATFEERIKMHLISLQVHRTLRKSGFTTYCQWAHAPAIARWYLPSCLHSRPSIQLIIKRFK